MNRIFHVYYLKDGINTGAIDITLTSVLSYMTHLKVAEVLAECLEDVFDDMQGENWSPNGEQRKLIEDLGLTHTSLSIDDAVFDVQNHRLYLCENFGWREL
jgi:hypothetical protein